jgi:hypothetical protein
VRDPDRNIEEKLNFHNISQLVAAKNHLAMHMLHLAAAKDQLAMQPSHFLAAKALTPLCKVAENVLRRYEKVFATRIG